MSPPTLPVAVDNQSPLNGRGAILVLAIRHIDEAITEADRRAAVLEDWYRRTYSSAHSGPLKQVYKATAQG